jgi:ATP-dependent DNA helicase RecG
MSAPNRQGLGAPLTTVVGASTAKALDKAFGMQSVRDLLWHRPRRFMPNGELSDLDDLPDGEQIWVTATIKRVSTRPMRQRNGHLVEVVIVGVAGDALRLVFFDRAPWRAKTLNPGDVGIFGGAVSTYREQRQLTYPEYVIFGTHGERARSSASASAQFGHQDLLELPLIPVYPATRAVSSFVIADAIRLALDHLDGLGDPLPEDLRDEHRLLSLPEALRAVHRPASYAEAARGTARLVWDEALVLQLALAQRRAHNRAAPAMARPRERGGILDAFDARLPFALTDGQREVGAVLEEELARTQPMQRLLQGEVGSGKTVVALRAMLQVVDAGAQAALLAPTEVLAAQHLRTVEALMGELAQEGRLGGTERATRIALLTGSQSAAVRRANLLEAASGAAGIVIGTHAVLQDPVQFADLGMVVIDEQHRFGVEQRDVLRAKAMTVPHTLVMTATPIPRTVAFTVFGELDSSTLRELPAGRVPIATSVVPAIEKPAWLDRAWDRVREEVQAGRQVYIVCPRIGPDEGEDGADVADGEPPADGSAPADGQPARPMRGVLETARMLGDGPLAGLRIGVMHGRLSADAKDDVMADFVAGRIDVLVATTVIEVGVDVANATVMAVLDADRFGVSQLHQLRGRVGRGGLPGLCLLITDAPPDSPARERLDAVAATLDGFELARLDLRQRREGDVLGAAQSGRAGSLRFLSVLDHDQVIAAARAAAERIVGADPSLSEFGGLSQHVADLLGREQVQYLDKS